jgi:FtsH-binding integral membrane protein
MPTATLYAVNYVGYFVGLAAVIVLCCCYESYGRRYPHNYILLSTFTVAEGFMLASACATYDLEIILTAAGMTAGITVALTLFAFQTKIDFTVMNQCLYIALNVFWMWGLFGWFGFLPAGTYKFYLLFGVLLFVSVITTSLSESCVHFI